MVPALLDELRGFKPSTTVLNGVTRVLPRQAIATVTVTTAAVPPDGVVLSGGAIAGIVLGSIAGTLLLLWILRSCMNLGAPLQEQRAWYDDVEPTRRTSHSHHHGSSHHGHRHSHSRSRRGSVEVRSTNAMPAVVVRDDGGPARSPRRPSATYVVQDGRGRSGGRYYAS